MSVTLGSLWWEWRTGLVTWWDYGLGGTPSVRVSEGVSVYVECWY